MEEKLEIFDLKGNSVGTMGRKEYDQKRQEEFEKTGEITTKLKTVRLLITSSKGRIYLQKRSKLKTSNAGLYDKTIGAHVSQGESYDLTLIRECTEELGFPVAILPEEEFKLAVNATDLSIVGIVKKLIHDDNYTSIRTIGSKKIKQPFLSTFYFGYYDGPMKFSDGEASGLETYSLEELEKELKTNSERFTEDLKYMIEKYKKHLKPIHNS